MLPLRQPSQDTALARRIIERLRYLVDGTSALEAPQGYLVTSAGAGRSQNHAVNAYWDGAFWRPRVVGQPASLLTMDSAGQLAVRVQAVSTNPITWGAASVVYAIVPSCRVAHSVNQSIPNATPTVLAFDTEQFDTAGLHDPAVNNSRITIPAGLGGSWLFGFTGYFDNVGAGNRHIFQIRADGTNIVATEECSPAVIAGGGYYAATPAGYYRLAAGQYLEVVAYQGGGGAVNVLAIALHSPHFWAVRISD